MHTTDTRWQDFPVFVGGHRKSGTTLFISLLDAHPELVVYPDDSSFFYAWYPLMDTDQYSDAAKIERMCATVLDIIRVDLERVDTGGYAFDHEDFKALYRQNMRDRACTPRDLLLCAVETLNQCSRVRPQNPHGWAEKTTSSEIYATRIFSWFPKAKFIHILRDPRDNFASLKSAWEKRYSKMNESMQHLTQSHLERCLMGFNMALKNTKIFSAEQYFVLRYEDLVQDAQNSMGRVAEFLGISWTSSLLQPTCMGFPWKGNNFEGKTFDMPDPVNAGRWRERITTQEAALVEFHFAEVMTRYGYIPCMSPQEQVVAAMEHYQWANFRKSV